MPFLGIDRVVNGDIRAPPGLLFLEDLVEQVSVIGLLRAQDIVETSGLQLANMRGIGVQGIFHHHRWQVGMILAQTLEEPFGSIPLAIVFRRPVLSEDRFGAKGDDLAKVGVDQGHPVKLLVVGYFRLATRPLCQKGVVAYLLGIVVAGAIAAE